MKDKPVLQLTITATEDGFLTIITGPSGVPAKYFDKVAKNVGEFVGSVCEKHLVSEWDWYKTQEPTTPPEENKPAERRNLN